MPLTIHADPVPLRPDATGTVRVAGTRVTLETVVEHLRAGASPQEIAERFPVLAAADAHAVFAYYLRHQEEVDRYLAEEAARADKTLEGLAAYRQPWSTVQERLQSRKGEAP